MMKRVRGRMLKVVLGSALLLASTSARADLWQGANPQRPKSLSVGAYSQLYFTPTGEFQVFANAEYGLSNRWQGELRIGAGTQPFYFGAFAKYLVASGDLVTVAWWGGIHAQTNGYIDNALILSRIFGRWEVYAAPLLSANLGKGETFALGLIPGFSVYVSRNMKLYTEAVINASHYYGALSVGFRLFL